MKKNRKTLRIILLVGCIWLTIQPSYSYETLNNTISTSLQPNKEVLATLASNKTSFSHNIIAEVLAPAELVADQKNIVRLLFHNSTDNSLLLGYVFEPIHQQHIHLYLANSDFSDFHHLHPHPTRVHGEYEFDFVPHSNGGYRAWANVKLISAEAEEYVTFDLGKLEYFNSSTISQNLIKSEWKYVFNLSFLTPPIVNKLGKGVIYITDKEGKPVNYLEPIMFNFANIMGFYPNSTKLLHIHPHTKNTVKSNKSRSGPLIEFELTPEQTGVLKLFFEVKIHQDDYILPFDVIVQ